MRGTAPEPDPVAQRRVVDGLVNAIEGELISIMSFTVSGERIVEIDILSDPDRLAAIDLSGMEH